MWVIGIWLVAHRAGVSLLPTGEKHNGQRTAAYLANLDMLPEPVLEKHTEDSEDSSLRVSVCAMQGWRRHMEDAHTCLLSLGPGYEDHRWFAVFDGHCGEQVSQWAAENLHRIVMEMPAFAAGDYAKALKEGMLRADEQLKGLLAPLLPKPPVRPGGSTAVCVLMTPPTADAPHGMLYCANVGDSRAVLARGGEYVPLSTDHKPALTDERLRVIFAGGFVRANRVNGQLAMSRALGDFCYKCHEKLPATKQMVTALPEVKTIALRGDEEFVVLACDGIWDCKTSEEVVDFLRPRLDPSQRPSRVCGQLFDSIVSPKPAGIGSDNMSIVTVEFKRRGEGPCIPVAGRTDEEEDPRVT